LHVLAYQPAPKSIRANLWKRVFTAILTGSDQDAQHSPVGLDTIIMDNNESFSRFVIDCGLYLEASSAYYKCSIRVRRSELYLANLPDTLYILEDFKQACQQTYGQIVKAAAVKLTNSVTSRVLSMHCKLSMRIIVPPTPNLPSKQRTSLFFAHRLFGASLTLQPATRSSGLHV